MNSLRPKLGDVIYVSRGIYDHYGIYVNDNRIIHFSPTKGSEINAKEVDIQVTTLEDFMKDRELKIDTKSIIKYSPEETIRRAESFIGKKKGEYNLAFNNCEHFARWCKSGEMKSYQVERVLKGIGLVMAVVAVVGIGLLIASVSSKGVSTKDDSDKDKS
jgi:hypothetical protein